MNISKTVQQAIRARAIAQSTIEKMEESVMTSADTRALATLYDAIEARGVEVKPN